MIISFTDYRGQKQYTHLVVGIVDAEYIGMKRFIVKIRPNAKRMNNLTWKECSSQDEALKEVRICMQTTGMSCYILRYEIQDLDLKADRKDYSEDGN
jgi:hypothetical protein